MKVDSQKHESADSNELLLNITPSELEKFQRLFAQFQAGEISFAELANIPSEFFFRIAEYAYIQFQRGNLDQAERLFEGLLLFDGKNAYYPRLLGAIAQKRKQNRKALGFYTLAVTLDPEDIVSHASRGEVAFKEGLREAALLDFEQAIALDPHQKNRWANRARFLKESLLKQGD